MFHSGSKNNGLQVANIVNDAPNDVEIIFYYTPDSVIAIQALKTVSRHIPLNWYTRFSEPQHQPHQQYRQRRFGDWLYTIYIRRVLFSLKMLMEQTITELTLHNGTRCGGACSSGRSSPDRRIGRKWQKYPRSHRVAHGTYP